MINEKIINGILDVSESYQAPARMLELMLDDQKRNETFKKFLEHETDMSYEWFQDYFEHEHAERKTNKQDFTPRSVSRLLAQLAGQTESYFESAAGNGGIMIQSWLQNKDNNDRFYRVEELSDRAIPFLLFNIAIRNMSGLVLHGDSLTREFKAVYELKGSAEGFSTIEQLNENLEPEQQFQTVLMNPPYSAKWSADKEFLNDPRFSEYKVLAPKSKADFAFLLHGYYHLKETGIMAIVLPHGVLFRGNAEGKIRKILLENGAIDAVIGLPANIFFNTSIPTTVIVLKKKRPTKDVLFIDASKDFEKGKNQNLLKDEHINKILDTYSKREDVEKYAHVASFKEIVDNDHNLNIPRFVDTFEEEEPIDIFQLSKEMLETDKQIQQAEKELSSMLDELAVTNESDEMLAALKNVFR